MRAPPGQAVNNPTLHHAVGRFLPSSVRPTRRQQQQLDSTRRPPRHLPKQSRAVFSPKQQQLLPLPRPSLLLLPNPPRKSPRSTTSDKSCCISRGEGAGDFRDARFCISDPCRADRRDVGGAALQGPAVSFPSLPPLLESNASSFCTGWKDGDECAYMGYRWVFSPRVNYSSPDEIPFAFPSFALSAAHAASCSGTRCRRSSASRRSRRAPTTHTCSASGASTGTLFLFSSIHPLFVYSSRSSRINRAHRLPCFLSSSSTPDY